MDVGVFVCMIIFVVYFIYIYINSLRQWENKSHHLKSQNVIDRYKKNICLLTRVKNVAYLLPQWIEFHIASGVDHFYIVNDCSSDNGNTVYWARFYEAQGLITFFPSHEFSNCTPHMPNEGKLFNFLFQKSKPRCDWTAVIDADEYIFPSTDAEYERIMKRKPDSFLKAVLSTFIVNPILRMPWYIMSSHGYERRPHGLITARYIDGMFQKLLKMKTIIRSRYVVSWTDSHHPLKFGWFSPSVEGKPLRDYNRPFLVQPNEMTYKNECSVPRSPLVIRHYRALSWEDFRSIRLNRTHTSFGGTNIWAKNPRRKWLEFNFSSHHSIQHKKSKKFNTSVNPHCYRLADSFRLKMNVEVELAARRRLQKFRNQLQINYSGSDDDYNAWLYGFKLKEDRQDNSTSTLFPPS